MKTMLKKLTTMTLAVSLVLAQPFSTAASESESSMESGSPNISIPATLSEN
ncbi:MAG: hypothetical protein K6E34_01400 [Lachnospiraceae bacterium]|nr:hypothetical protein [Lachnospiraceae bacterium]